MASTLDLVENHDRILSAVRIIETLDARGDSSVAGIDGGIDSEGEAKTVGSPLTML
jgi:hypothetical protein